MDVDIAQEIDRDERKVELRDAGVEGQEDADVVALLAEGARQSGRDIAQSAGLGDRRDFGGDLADPEAHRWAAFLSLGRC